MEIYHPERSQGFKEKIIASLSFYSEGFSEAVESRGIRADIPRVFLHGTQEKEEYSQKKRKQVEALFGERGIEFLRENPIIVCVVPNRDTLMFAIIDGHHRARYSGTFGIDNLPCVILSPEELADVKNESARKKGLQTRFDAKGVIATLRHDVAATISSFSRTMPNYKMPLEVTSLYQLYTTI